MTDWPPKREHILIEELRHIVSRYPMESGDTLMGTGACECARRKWVTRDKKGRYIPTALGLAVLEQHSGKGGKP